MKTNGFQHQPLTTRKLFEKKYIDLSLTPDSSISINKCASQLKDYPKSVYLKKRIFQKQASEEMRRTGITERNFDSQDFASKFFNGNFKQIAKSAKSSVFLSTGLDEHRSLTGFKITNQFNHLHLKEINPTEYAYANGREESAKNKGFKGYNFSTLNSNRNIVKFSNKISINSGETLRKKSLTLKRFDKKLLKASYFEIR